MESPKRGDIGRIMGNLGMNLGMVRASRMSIERSVQKDRELFEKQMEQ